jgi:hypothetical protein
VLQHAFHDGLPLRCLPLKLLRITLLGLQVLFEISLFLLFSRIRNLFFLLDASKLSIESLFFRLRFFNWRVGFCFLKHFLVESFLFLVDNCSFTSSFFILQLFKLFVDFLALVFCNLVFVLLALPESLVVEVGVFVQAGAVNASYHLNLL